MIHASLFSGIGGPEVAAAMMGWTNAFHCEINPFGRAVLDYWFPDSKSYEDITKTDFSEWRGKIDILTGGFPCQPFSYAGKRGGAEDDRYLWPEMLRVVEQIRPTWVIGENVNGITTMVEGGILTPMAGEATLFGEGDGVHRYGLRQSFTLERVCRDLEGLGYSVQPIVIPAASVGAPHRRDRVFILANATNSLHDNTVRTAGGDEGKGGEERLWERDKVERFAESNYVRSEMRCDATHTSLGLCDGSAIGVSRNQEQPQPEFGDSHLKDAPHTEGEQGRPTPHGRSGGKGQEQPRRRGGEDVGDATDTYRERCRKSIAAEIARVSERFNSKAVPGWVSRSLYPERRWAEFPTVSPIHRGNDGIPFPVDGLTLPWVKWNPSDADRKRGNFSKWRTEALKAYGNAIVPQVMYEIFRAIEQVENP